MIRLLAVVFVHVSELSQISRWRQVVAGCVMVVAVVGVKCACSMGMSVSVGANDASKNERKRDRGCNHPRQTKPANSHAHSISLHQSRTSVMRT